MKISLTPHRAICFVASCALLLIAPLLHAESRNGRIEGSVIDAKNHKVVEAAAVELLQKTDTSLVTGVITDADGRYSFSQVPPGEYLLRLSCLGYQVKVLPSFSITPEKNVIRFTSTALVSLSKNIDEVSVYAHLLTGTMDDDKTVYNVTPEAAEVATSALELLRQVPEVTVDYITNDVTLQGSSNLLYLVNGRKVEKEYLRQLNPNLIERYEISTNPGVKYEADVDGVIQIVLKRSFQYGLRGAVNVEIPTSTQSYFSYSNTNIDYYKNGLRLFVNAYGGGNRWDMDMNRQRSLLSDPENLRINRYTDVNIINTYTGMSYGFDWFIDNHNTLNFSSSLNPRTPNTIDATTDSYLIRNISDSTTRYDKYHNLQKNGYNDYSLYFEHRFAQEGHNLSAELYYSTNSKTQDLEFTDSVTAPLPTVNQVTREYSDNNKKIIRSKLDYNYPLNSWLKVSVGASNINTLFNNLQSTYAENEHQLHYNEYRIAAYSNLSATFGKQNIQAGIRYEASDIDIKYHHLNNDTSTGNRYMEWLPYLSYSTSLGERHSIRLNYRKSITRPGMDQVNPFVQEDDPYYTSSGNSNLRPSLSHKVELSHRIKIYGPLFLTYRPFAEYQNDNIYSVNTLTSNGTVARKQQNVSEQFNYGMEVNANLAFVKWWMIIPNFRWINQHVEQAEQYEIAGFHENSYHWGIQNNFVLPRELYLFVNYEYSTMDYTHQTTNRPENIFVTGFYKKVNDRWGITAFTINPWRHSFHTRNGLTQSPDYIENELSSINYSYIFNVRISYNFNIGNEVKKLDRSVESDKEAVKGGGLF